MDIYKLSDFDDGQSKPIKKYKITNLKQGVKNPERVNVFVDEKYSFSLDISQVVDFKIKVGQEIDEEELEEFKKASEFGKLYQRTLEWVLIRPRAERETIDYLNRKIYEKKINRDYIKKITNKLKDKKYLDDREFAKWYVENRFLKKGISKRRLMMELARKGISKDIIDEVLSIRNDEDEILKIIAKKRTKYDDDKLIQYLCRQGFSFEQAQNLVRTYGRD